MKERKQLTQGSRFLQSFKLAKEGDYERGAESEKRALEILNKCAEAGLFLKVSRASKKQDKKQGIDFFGHIESGDEVLKIPFQIKSSYLGAVKFTQESRDKIHKKNIVTLIANKYRSEKDILEQIRYGLVGKWNQDDAVVRAGMAEVVNARV